MKSSIHLLAVATSAVFSLAGTQAHAAVFTGSFSFTGLAGSVPSLPYNGTTLDNVTASSFSKVGVSSMLANNVFGATNWGTGATDSQDTFSGTIDLGKYYEFTLTAAAGQTLDMSSLSFGLSRQATGPRQFEWRTSVDGYGSSLSFSAFNDSLSQAGGVLTTPDIATGFTGNSLDLSGAQYQGLESITFRFYAYNAEASSGTGGLVGPVTFTGSTVPEASAALLGAIGSVALLRRRR